jgi:hypothetical protein
MSLEHPARRQHAEVGLAGGSEAVETHRTSHLDHGPIDDRGEMLGLLATCVLFYCGSCAIEYVVLVGVLTPVHGANVFAATIWANTWSYGLIALSVVTLFVTFLITKRARRSSPG